MKNTAEKFYMIYVEGERGSTFKHSTLPQAITEAKRLSEATGKEAVILEAIKSYKLVKFEETEYSDLPF